ncbi:MAG: hypothetical protein IPP58_00020 [Holophagaceae bacterium]|uniref:Uncharacterized protein n=1 Tax=Candidatus Geothrix skivensis TaxID=2954439 RepID=A0A9D7SDI1_9BACT|nr:hypothetical protein [Candidatus Geothrix skivensis]
MDLPPSDAPTTFLAWFRQTLNDIKAVSHRRPHLQGQPGGEETMEGRAVQRLLFNAPTAGWDAKKRSRAWPRAWASGSAASWKSWWTRPPATPLRLDFRNDEQGVQTRMDFSYGSGGRLQSVNISNSSRGFEGPGWLRVGYGGDGRMANVAGELASQDKKVSFAMDLAWSKTPHRRRYRRHPPAGATKRGPVEMETQLLVGLAAKIFDLQRAGLNLRAVAVGGSSEARAPAAPIVEYHPENRTGGIPNTGL